MQENPSCGIHLVISGTLLTLILLLWPVLMAFSQPMGTVDQQLQWVLQHQAVYKANFLLAFFIAPAMIYLIVAQLNAISFIGKMSVRLGMLFLALYATFVSISYASQVILLPRLLQGGLIQEAMLWYFNSPFSVAYFLNQMGYFFWAMGVIILFHQSIRVIGIFRYIGYIYLLSAVLSLLAFTGLILDHATLNSLTFASGLLLLPVGILTIIAGRRKIKPV
jgi:uncharacterized membrane protein